MRYWLNPKPADPILFETQVQAVCDCYLNAIERFEKFGTRTICVDEMTGLQALERIAPTKPTRPGLISRHEFEYQRHGTMCLTGNFEVATGQVISPTFGARRTEQDFLDHIKRTVAIDSSAHWIFIVDNLNTHSTISLVRWINEFCELDCDLGVERRRGILGSMASRKEFLSDQSHQVRFQYLPLHTSWLNQIEIWFGILSRRVLKRGSFSSLESLQHRVEAFINYFNNTFAKPFKWTYTGRPLNI